MNERFESHDSQLANQKVQETLQARQELLDTAYLLGDGIIMSNPVVIDGTNYSAVMVIHNGVDHSDSELRPLEIGEPRQTRIQIFTLAKNDGSEVYSDLLWLDKIVSEAGVLSASFQQVKNGLPIRNRKGASVKDFYKNYTDDIKTFFPDFNTQQ